MAVDLRWEYNKEANRLSTLLLGLAASAVAFSFHETTDWPLQRALIPLALAVGVWAISFGAGIVWAHGVQSAMSANIAIGEIPNTHPRYGEAEAMLQAAATRTRRAYATQLWCLLAGALFYFAGQALHIADNPPPPAHQAKPV